jgi:hypothetical protein
MPIQIEEAKTPKGRRMMLAKVTGHVSMADAEAMGKLLQPGQPYHRALILSIVDKSTDYHPDARRHFQTFNNNFDRMATVVSSVLLRAAINFMAKVGGTGDRMQMFATEADAVSWLDGVA